MSLRAIGFVRLQRSAIILTHDLLVALISLVLALLLLRGGWLDGVDVAWILHTAPLLLMAAFASYLLTSLHRHVWSFMSIGELAPIAMAATLAIVLFAGICAAAQMALDHPPTLFVIQWFVLLVGLCATRVVYRFVKTRSGRGPPPGTVRDLSVLLYGCGPIASFFIQAVQSMPDSKIRVVGIIDDDVQRHGRRLGSVPVLGALRDLDRILAELSVQGIHPRRLLVAETAESLMAEVRRAVERCRDRHLLEIQFLPLRTQCAPDISSSPRASVSAEVIGAAVTPNWLYFRIRRVVEVIAIVLALPVLAPLMATIAVAVLVDLGRPILFSQVRPGRYMRLFTLYKFRTMRPAYVDGAIVPDRERSSALGRILRDSRLDELPQVLNVLRGDMSFIGPRPLLPCDLPSDVTERVTVRPGITGWAQVNGGNHITADEKGMLDRWYVCHASPLVDGRIVGLTLLTMLVGERVGREEVERARRWLDGTPAGSARLLPTALPALSHENTMILEPAQRAAPRAAVR
jgi:lipopolysaccharide/colanic/teichoic acid biosynthesis glycosyltransferase